MQNPILDYLSRYITLTKEETDLILGGNHIKHFKKGEVMLREGEISKNCFFVLKGIVRSYYLVNGEERITEFYTEAQPITPVSYNTREPSEYFLSCVEDCIVSIGSPESTEELFEKIPRMKSIALIISGEMLAENQVSFDNFRNLPPEERYAKLQETRADLCNRVPQYMLASYLGIKPESLSRIRKRMTQQNQ